MLIRLLRREDGRTNTDRTGALLRHRMVKLPNKVPAVHFRVDVCHLRFSVAHVTVGAAERVHEIREHGAQRMWIIQEGPSLVFGTQRLSRVPVG